VLWRLALHRRAVESLAHPLLESLALLRTEVPVTRAAAAPETAE
jgi:hypothetical protein